MADMLSAAGSSIQTTWRARYLIKLVLVVKGRGRRRRRLRFVGAEPGSRDSQGFLDPRCQRVLATEHAPRGPFNLLERRHGLAEIVECGAGVIVERPPVIRPHQEREIMTLAENAARHGDHSAQQSPGFFEAFESNKGRHVVAMGSPNRGPCGGGSTRRPSRSRRPGSRRTSPARRGSRRIFRDEGFAGK